MSLRCYSDSSWLRRLQCRHALKCITVCYRCDYHVMYAAAQSAVVSVPVKLAVADPAQ